MRLNVVLRYTGLMLLLNAGFMLVSACISLFNNLDTGFYPLLLSFLLTSVLGAFPLIFMPKGEQISTKEGYGIVVGSWIVACLAGMLPYMLWGGEFNLINAWFESVSGYTTTGSTILNDVEALPDGMMFWRSTTHWLGGVGVVMFALVVLPSSGAQNRMKLSNMELSSMAKENYRYKTQKILHILLVVYVGLTFAQTILLKLAGMDWFDAVNNSFSTIATGGFSTKNLSIAYYDNVWIEIIMIFFMAVAGLHFGLIFATLTGKSNNVFRSEVSRYYLISLLVGSLIMAFSLWINDVYPTFLSSFRYSLFQAVSVASTTGSATADTTVWPPVAVLLIIFFTMQCACAGSTAGGIKCDRILLSFKAIKAQILQLQHPNAIIRVKMNGMIQDNAVVNQAILFIWFYLMIVAVGVLLISFFGIDLTTSFGITIGSMGNVGPGLGEVGSLDNYHLLPPGVKFICTILMLLGRLELFGFIQLFLIKWWK